MEHEVTDRGEDTPSRTFTVSRPKDWATDSLTRFLVSLEEQAVATFANARPLVQTLLEFDSMFVMHAAGMFQGTRASETAAPLLAIRALSLQRAAVRLVMSGQLYEAKVVLRAVIESSVYAWATAGDASLRRAWEEREK